MVIEVGALLAGLVLKPWVEDALTLLEDYVGDVVKDTAVDAGKNLLRRDAVKAGAKKAGAAFVKEFEAELVNADLSDAEIGSLGSSLKVFFSSAAVRDVAARRVLGTDTIADVMLVKALEREWAQTQAQSLPTNFDWAGVVRRHSRLVQRIIESDDTLREIENTRSLSILASAARTQSLQRDGSQELDQYAATVRRVLGPLKLEVLDPNPDHGDIALTAVFVAPTLVEVPHAATDLLEDASGPQSSRDGTSAEVVLADPGRRLLVVLGHPGSGKSVLLAMLALQWAEQPAPQRSRLPVPLLVDLRHFASVAQKDIALDFLKYFDGTRGSLWSVPLNAARELLSAGRASLLFDGLDEIYDPSLRRDVAHEIARLSVLHPNARIVVSSRRVGFRHLSPVLHSHGFETWAVAPLGEEQQRELILRWHRAAYREPAEGERKLRRLTTMLAQSLPVSEMASNPLLLTLMCLLNRHHELPRDRNTLFDRASALLLEQWDLSKLVQQDPELERLSLDSKDKQLILKRVALRMQGSNGVINAISEDDLVGTIKECLEGDLGQPSARGLSVRVVRQLRERNYILCLLGAQDYAFVHRCFLEFFFSWAQVARYSEVSESRRVPLSQLIAETFGGHWQEDSWHEVLRLIVARLGPEDAQRVIEHLLDLESTENSLEPVWLAAACCVEFRNPGRYAPVFSRLERSLLRIASGQKATRTFGSSASSVEVQRFLERQDSVRAIEAISRLLAPSLEAIQSLRGIARSSRNHIVRSAALKAYSRLVQPDDATWHLLTWLADVDNEKVWQVRQSAIRALARAFPVPKTAEVLEEIAANVKEASEVREAAEQEVKVLRRAEGK